MKKILLGLLLLLVTPLGAQLPNVGTVDGAILTSGADADSTTTSSDSGLEYVGGLLALLRGCSDTQVLKWDETNDEWDCAADGTGTPGFTDAVDPVVQVTIASDVHIGDGAGTLTGKLEIGGDADQPQLVIEAFSTQTDDVFIIQNDSDTEVFTVSVLGRVVADRVDVGSAGLYLLGPNNNIDVDSSKTIVLGQSGVSLRLRNDYSSTDPVFDLSMNATSVELTGSSGVQVLFAVFPEYEQSSTAGSTDLLINRTETSIGSGTHLFTDFQVEDVSQFSVSNTGAVTLASTLDGRDIATDGTKLDGIETSADVTDFANVNTALNGGDITITGGNLTLTAGLIRRDTNATITASTTQTQGNGALTAEYNEISVVATTNDTVTLPAAVAGLKIVVINNGANTLQIFPASGDNLGSGVDTATTLGAGLRTDFAAFDSTTYGTGRSFDSIDVLGEVKTTGNVSVGSLTSGLASLHVFETVSGEITRFHNSASGTPANWWGFYDTGGRTSHFGHNSSGSDDLHIMNDTSTGSLVLGTVGAAKVTIASGGDVTFTGLIDGTATGVANLIGASPPSTCTAGTFFIDTDETNDTNCTTTADNSLCLCVVTDTWVALENN